MDYNDPFYFALTDGQRPAAVVAHIAATYGVKGRAELVRVEPTYRLCRIIAN